MRRASVGLAAAFLLGGAAESRADFIVWTNPTAGTIERANLDGSGQTTIVTGLTVPIGIAADGGRLYWTETNATKSANLDGTGIQTLEAFPSNHGGLALDLPDGKVFFTTGNVGGTIYTVPIAGGSLTPVITGIVRPISPALDLLHSKIYWIEEKLPADGSKIWSANIDGTGQSVVLSPLYFPQGIALDPSNGKMYWTDANADSIYRANLDGTGMSAVLTGLDQPTGLALDLPNGKMYWAETLGGNIRSANLDGTGMTTLVSGLSEPFAVALEITTAGPAAPEPGSMVLLFIGAVVIGVGMHRRSADSTDAC